MQPSILPRCLAVLGLSICITSSLYAQKGELPSGGFAALRTAYSKNLPIIRQLLSGEIEDPTKDPAPEALSVLAKYYVYPFTQRDLGGQTVNKLHASLDADIFQFNKNRAKTQRNLEEFAKQVVALSDDMLNNDERLARVNYMRVLLRFAQEGTEVVADPMIKSLQDASQNDGVKYWALQGLRELFARAHQFPPAPLKDKKRETAAILALVQFIERKPDGVDLLPPEEQEGVRVLRREAVKALALTRYPALLDDNKELAARTAQVLMRIIAHDGWMPEVKYDEQIEAALGLCRMENKLFPDYQPDAAARFIGLGVVELANAYAQDAQKERGWKIYGARLTEALAVLESETKSTKGLAPAASTYILAVVKDARDLAKGMESRANVNPSRLGSWLRSNVPPNDSAYKGRPDSVVKFPE